MLNLSLYYGGGILYKLQLIDAATNKVVREEMVEMDIVMAVINDSERTKEEDSPNYILGQDMLMRVGEYVKFEMETKNGVTTYKVYYKLELLPIQPMVGQLN